MISGDRMQGIDLNQPVSYQTASLRYFKPWEHHVSRFCRDNVLLLVFAGVLRFREDGIDYEVHPGEYHIQRSNSTQEGPYPSDSPQYLYVHFQAAWDSSALSALPRRGVFRYADLKSQMEALDRLEHSGAPYVLKAGVFFSLLSDLYDPKPASPMANRLATYVEEHYAQPITLDILCREFHFSKNHIIHLFQEAFDATPIAYINRIRLRKAEHRMIVFSESLEQIALQCGFRTYSHFYKLFCREHSLSPEQWRQKKRLE